MLIGINGFKGVGKDTVGEYLVVEHGFQRASFAEKLKDSAAALFDINPILWETWKNDPNAKVGLINSAGKILTRGNLITVREFLQRYGTEAHRDIFGSDFWVDHGMKGIDPNKDYVFTDARFENELSKIKSMGGINIRVIRESVYETDTHASEIAPPQHLIDHIIFNNGTKYDLYSEIDDLIHELSLNEPYESVYGGTYGDWRDNSGNYGE